MVVITNDRPAYRVMNEKGFFGPDDNLYIEGECIYFDGEPNEMLEPLNEPAKKNMTAYLEKLDAFGQAAALKAGRPWTGRPRDIDGALTLARYDEEYKKTLRGVVKDNTGISTVEQSETPETGQSSSKKPRGRPKASLTI